MNSRKLRAGLVVLAVSLFPLVGTAPASAASSGTCVVHSLPNFVAQGEFGAQATVADVIQVGCDPNVYGTGSTMKIQASQLFSSCKNRLTWFIPDPFKEVKNTLGVTVKLDADGNATVALLAGPGCSPTEESLISAHQMEEPFETFTTAFTVEPPHNTPKRVIARPEKEVEDALSSGVATIIEVEVPGGSEKKVRVGSEEFFSRCRRAPHLDWVRMNGNVEANKSEIKGLQLDNNGNGFVIAIGNSSCAEGSSLIEADLESKPFTTLTGNFIIEAPIPLV